MNNTFVLTALDGLQEEGRGGRGQRGLGQEGGGDGPPADDQ